MGLKNLPNSKASAFESINYCVNSASMWTMSSGYVSEVAAIGKCPLREVRLFYGPRGCFIKKLCLNFGFF